MDYIALIAVIALIASIANGSLGQISVSCELLFPPLLFLQGKVLSHMWIGVAKWCVWQDVGGGIWGIWVVFPLG